MPHRTHQSKIWQYDIVIKGRRFRGSCGTEDFHEAKTVEAQVRLDAKRDASRVARYTLSEALGTYFRDVAIGSPSEATTRSQAKAILAQMNGKMALAQITDADIRHYVSKDRSKCKNATVNRRLQMLSRAIKHMAKVYKADVPSLDLKGAETKEPERVRELGLDEQHALFAALPEEYHAFVSFSLLTGARISAISNLKWPAVDMARREITFILKGGKTMIFPMNAEIASLLSALPRSNDINRNRGFVFTRVCGHTAERVQIGSNGGVFGTAWRKALSDAGIEDYHFHDNRHTFATRMLRQTQNLKLVSRLLGHAKIESTVRYAHVLIDDMRAAMNDYSLHGTGPREVDPQYNPQYDKY